MCEGFFLFISFKLLDYAQIKLAFHVDPGYNNMLYLIKTHKLSWGVPLNFTINILLETDV